MSKNKYKAQVLVIVVMVLMLLAIIILGIVAVVTRDVEQSLGSREYEMSYNKSEEQIFKILDKYSNTAVGLEGLIADGYSCTGGAVTGYDCGFVDDKLATTMKVMDTNIVEDFELGKDETFKVILGGTYKNNVTIQWTGNAAISLTLEYKNGNDYLVKKDVYDNSGLYTRAGTNPAHHELSIVVPGGATNTIIVNTGSGLSVADQPLFLKIKPMMEEGIYTLLNVKGVDSSFPKQVRRIEAVSYYEGVNAPSSAPVVITQIPLAGQEPEILNYVLRTESTINKRKASPY